MAQFFKRLFKVVDFLLISEPPHDWIVALIVSGFKRISSKPESRQIYFVSVLNSENVPTVLAFRVVCETFVTNARATSSRIFFFVFYASSFDTCATMPCHFLTRSYARFNERHALEVSVVNRTTPIELIESERCFPFI